MENNVYRSVIDKIRDICSEVSGYSFAFGAEKMQAVISDKTKLPCIYLEEYRDGEYNVGSYTNLLPHKSTYIDLYFINTINSSAFTPDTIVYERERVRNSMESTGVFKFMEKFKEKTVLGEFKDISEYKFYIPKPRFDEKNEVSLMLRIYCEEDYCL